MSEHDLKKKLHEACEDAVAAWNRGDKQTALRAEWRISVLLLQGESR